MLPRACIAPSILAALLVLAVPATAQPLSARDRAHIAAMENGLLPPVVIRGRPIPVETLAGRMKATNTPGVSIAFIEDGRIAWTKTYGLADVASARPVTPETLFQAASITKPVTATAAMRLVQEGRLDLDQDVNLRLRAWKVPASAFTALRKVTLRGILSHTAGLTVHGFDGYPPGHPLPTTVQILNGQPPANSAPVVSDAEPGEHWAYSGGGYVIAQLLMTEATGEAYPRLMDKLVLRPAGMTRSTYEQPLSPSLRDQAATGYGADGKPMPGGGNVFPELGPAGLWTTPSDLARFAIALQDAWSGASQAILTKATARTMFTRGPGDWGLGLDLGRPGGPVTFAHGGSNQGFHSELLAFAGGARQGVAIMTNGEGGAMLSTEILRAVSKSYGWGVAKPRVKTIVRLAPGALAPLTGVYEIPGVARLTFTAEGGRLYMSTPQLGSEKLEFLPESPSKFFVLANGVSAEFIGVASGKAGKVKLGGGFGDWQATRVP